MKIPTYENKAISQGGQIAPYKNESSAGQVGREIANAGNTLFNSAVGIIKQQNEYQQAVNEEFKKLQAYQQINKAKVDNYKNRTLIDEAAAKDPTIDTPETQSKYISELRASQTESANGILDERTKMQFMAESEIDIIKQEANLRKYGRENIISQTKVTTAGQIETLQKEYVSAGTAELRESLLNQALEKIDTLENGQWSAGDKENLMQGQGILTPEEAAKWKDKIKATWNKTALNILIAEEPEKTRNQIANNQFPSLTIDERKTYLDIADSTIKVKQEKYVYDKKREIETKFNAGQLTTQDLADISEENILTPSQLASYSKKIADPNYKVGTNYTIYNNLLKQITDTQADDIKTYDNVLNAFADDKLSKDSFADLMGLITPEYQVAVNKEKYYTPEQRGVLASIGFFMKSFVNPSEKAKMASAFLKETRDKNMSEEQLMQKAREIHKSYFIQNNPETVALEDVPNMIIDSNGVKDEYDGETTVKADMKAKSQPKTQEQYKIGSIVSANGKNYKVIGFYDDGEPNVLEIK